MYSPRTLAYGLGLASLVATIPSLAGANPQSGMLGGATTLSKVPFKGQDPIRFVPFSFREITGQTPNAGATIVLDDGRVVNAYAYLRALNSTERELASFGTSLRSPDSDLGTVARSSLKSPRFSFQQTSIMPANATPHPQWLHEINHDFASVKSQGQVVQSQSTTEGSNTYSRTTTHTVSGRLFDAHSPSIAQFVQSVGRDAAGEEFRETQVYINGRQIFRHGRSDNQEARIWKTAFDVPLKSITVPVGPGSIDAKLGIRGGVNLDLDIAPSAGNRANPQISLNFKPQVVVDGYVTAMTTPTNIGDAGFEGAINLADNTLKINGTAAISFPKFVDLKEATIDNVFAGFSGKIVGFANIKMPSKNSDGSDKKKFEKEFYKWDGIKVEQRLYEYKAPEPQPTDI
jgi:hypothetical protein